MKKRIAFLAALVLTFSLTACSIPLAQPVTTEPETTGQQQTSFESVGPWHIDPALNDTAHLAEVFPGYGEFGATMEIRSDGRISWYIGSIGGFGTYTRQGATLRVELTQATRVPNGDPESWSMDFTVQEADDRLVLDYDGTRVIWSYGDSGEIPAYGDSMDAGDDVVYVVNLRGDTATLYKLADGTYMDRTSTRFIFDGVDTWTDEQGAAWNEQLRP